MIHREVGTTGVEMSILALGGHEYLPDGRSRGFNEDLRLATRPGYIFDGFGGDKRMQVLAAAFEHGIDFLDVTMDSEKEALGRGLKEIPPRDEICIQTRPEGMVYGYDECNARWSISTSPTS